MTSNPYDHLPLLFETTPIAIIEWNSSFDTVTGWNPAAESIFGYTAAEMIHTNAVHLIPEYEIERVTSTIAEILRERKSSTCINKNICKDGRTILCEWTNTPVCRGDGELVCIYSLVQDVTGRLVTQKELEESEQRFRDVSEAVGEYIWEISREGVYAFISDRVKDVKGYTATELLGKTPFVVMLPEDIPVVEEILKEACDRKGSFRLTHRNITPTGDVVWEEVNGLPLLNSEGEIIGFRGAGLSITDRKHAEEALRESEARFNSIAANIPGVILRYALSPDGTHAFQYVSHGCEDLYGVTAETAMADPTAFFGRTHPDDVGKLQQSILDSATSMGQWSSEYRLLLPSGEEKWISGRGMPERQENGDIIWNTMLLDITPQKKAELALRESEARFQSIANNMPGLILRYILRHDQTDGFLYLSSRCVDFFEVSPEEVLESSHKI